MLHDDLNDVLATTTHPAPPWHPWHRPGHLAGDLDPQWGAAASSSRPRATALDVLEHPTVRTIIERGMLWATRRA